MPTVTLTLTEQQAEILGYALTVAARKRRADRMKYKAGGAAHATASEQIARIEELRAVLNAAPTVEGGEA